eukprot:TRINITY_DN23578_c0_g1_i1.p1 TRINITY_DN23578_c0_g1~~TRINITY_DN23578_c0_g1_i1.p1  ORF type:complete len:374 (-),score=45.59 TRINITY_DN23578_c0_g1_i1:285-1406(-)
MAAARWRLCCVAHGALRRKVAQLTQFAGQPLHVGARATRCRWRDLGRAVARGSGFCMALAWSGFPGLLNCEPEPRQALGAKTSVLRVEGMGCQGCVGRVRQALESVAGVCSARVDLQAKLAHVQGDVVADDLVAAVQSAGKTAQFVGSAGIDGFVTMTASELKASLGSRGMRGIVLDIDETLSATNVAWFNRLEELFGNPEEVPIEDLIGQYKLAQNVPFWQSKEAYSWMQKQRDDPKAQDDLPLVPGAVEGAHTLKNIIPIVGYCTVRPESVNDNTIAWLRDNSFPDLPVVAKPKDVPFEDGNKWKASSLHAMWPEVTGIVDDNPKIPLFAGDSYPGTIFLFSHAHCPPGTTHAEPCATWPAVVEAARSLSK